MKSRWGFVGVVFSYGVLFFQEFLLFRKDGGVGLVWMRM